MRAVILAALLTACGGSDSDSFHGDVQCGASWSTSTVTLDTCEAACEEVPTTGQAPCDGTNPSDPDPHICTDTFLFDGAKGCCVAVPTDGTSTQYDVRFYECE